MINLFRTKIGFVVVLMLVFLLIPVIVSYSAEKEVNKNKLPVRVAIIPFQSITLEAEAATGGTVVCPLCGTVYFGGKIAKGGEKVVEELFIEKLKDYKEIEIIPQDKVDAIYKRVSAESLKMPLLKIIKKVGPEVGADLVAVGYVFRYVERIGYNYSVEKPASIAFEINFVSPKDGNTVWRNAFDKTQKSLMEDVFHVSSLRWLTARELAKQGMNQAFKTFPGLDH